MAKQTKQPKVRIARPTNRPFQLRYTCPTEGREVRISIGCRDENVAETEKAKLEAELLLGIRRDKKARVVIGPQMPWELFRDKYRELRLALLRDPESAEVRLDLCDKIVSPRTLGEMARIETLDELQAKLLAGHCRQKGRSGPRSPHTVESHMRTLLAALNWAAAKGRKWIEPVEFDVLETDDLDAMKGRPIAEAEFQKMLDATAAVCRVGPESWNFLMGGIWQTGLRLSEAMRFSWDLPKTIQPMRTKGGVVVLRIPAGFQKNRKDQMIPTIPEFVELLESVPVDARNGWVFNPMKQRGGTRMDQHKQVSRKITAIGAEAGIVVNDDGKFASAHDFRRSFGQRLADAGVPPTDLQKIMRHSSFATTQKYYLKADAVEQAERIALYLGTGKEELSKGEIEKDDVSRCVPISARERT
jgi:integrase